LSLMCHYDNLALISGLGLGYAVACWRQAEPARRLGDLLTLAAVPLIVGVAVMGMNWHAFGNPLRTGYSNYMDVGRVLIPARLGRNIGGLATIILGAPWLALGALALWRAFSTRAPWRACALAVLLAMVMQQLFWLSFSDYYRSPLRYELPLLMVAAVALPALADGWEARWPRRGLGYATLLMVPLGAASFLHGNNDFYPPFINDPDDPMFPGQVTFAGWYARALPYHLHPDYLFTADGFDPAYAYPLTPVGAVQLCTLILLVGGGALLLARAWSQARTADRVAAASTDAAPAPVSDPR
jgi:hypothetical protein